MPSRPPTVCGRCGATVPPGTRCACAKANTKAHALAYDQARGSAAARGYDHTWRKLRDAHLSMSPLCIECLNDEIVEVAVDVDHVIPISVWPEGRLVASNLQSLCRKHHNEKTRRETAARR